MSATEIVIEEFEMLRDALYPAVNGLSLEEVTYRPDEESNSIAWLAWHLARLQDAAVARLSGAEPVWTSRGWYERFELGLPPEDTGTGHGPDSVAVVAVDARSLLDYFEDVHERTLAWLRSIDDAELVRPVGSDPRVTVASRLVGVLVDDLQHVGQAAYLRGVIQRRGDRVPTGT